MDGARDIAGFIIPYSAGIFISVVGAAALGSLIGPAASVSSAIAAISLIIMVLPCRKRIHPAFTRALIATAGVACGIMCGLTAVMTSWSHAADTGWLADTALSFRLSLEATIDAIPFQSSDTSALIKALLTGNRESLPAHISEAFRASGASHILALSGLHLGMIYGILVKALGILGNSPCARIIRSVLITASCGFYTLATGAGPSITRAFLFILLGEAGRMTGRDHSLGTILASALLIQLSFAPLSAGSVGFQLSYAAMAGIAFIYPRIIGLWPERPSGPLRWIWKSAAISISCQLTTGPVAWHYFGTFPQYFMLTNMTALPLTGMIIPGAVAVIVLNLMGICPDILIKSLEGIIVIMTDALEIISTM